MAKFELDMDSILEQAFKALEGLLSDPGNLRSILEKYVTIVRPGDTIFLRFSHAMSRPEAHDIFHNLQPVAERNGLTIALVDNCDSIYVMRREDYAESQQHSHEAETKHQESLPLPPPALPDGHASLGRSPIPYDSARIGILPGHMATGTGPTTEMEWKPEPGSRYL